MKSLEGVASASGLSSLGNNSAVGLYKNMELKKQRH